MTNDPPNIHSDGGNPTQFDGAGVPREDWAQSDDASSSPGPIMSQGDSPTNWADHQLQQFVDDGTEIPPDMLDEQKAVLLKPGDLVNNRFEVVKQLGFGGMGAVYHVKDRFTEQDRALKVMLPSLLKSEGARKRFQSEVIISQKLGHKNIVRIHDIMVDRTRRIYFFTMELVEGKTLHRVLNERGGTLPLSEALHIAHQLCDALAYAHELTVHRDLKPQNIMVQPDGTIKILDFGLAKLMSPGRLTKSSMALGTAYYQAPEQSVHLSELDQRADLYSVGIILYQMLTGTDCDWLRQTGFAVEPRRAEATRQGDFPVPGARTGRSLRKRGGVEQSHWFRGQARRTEVARSRRGCPHCRACGRVHVYARRGWSARGAAPPLELRRRRHGRFPVQGERLRLNPRNCPPRPNRPARRGWRRCKRNRRHGPRVQRSTPGNCLPRRKICSTARMMTTARRRSARPWRSTARRRGTVREGRGGGRAHHRGY